MFKFNKNSAIVKIWVTLVLNGTYNLEQVPKLFNLKEMVELILKELQDDTN